jgi:hypothetical protein
MKNDKPLRERELQRLCAMHFSQLGFLTCEEVPFLFKVADLFCFHEGSGECLAVEVKIRDWRRALKQACVYLMMADKVYIALHDGSVDSADLDALSDVGVGLLAISRSGCIRTVLEAPPSSRRISHFVARAVATAFPGTISPACLAL